jgi:hypothetical protein
MAMDTSGKSQLVIPLPAMFYTLIMHLRIRQFPILCLVPCALVILRGQAMADPDETPGATEEAFSSTGLVTGTLMPGSAETVRFGVIGDYGVSGASLENISRMIRSWNPDFILSTGDNTYGDLNPNLDRSAILPGIHNVWEFNIGAYFGAYLPQRAVLKFPLQTSPTTRFFPTVGNHDSAPDSGNGGTIEGYLDYFHNNPGGQPRLPTDRGAVHNQDVSYYAIRRGPIDIFVLDGDIPTRPDLAAAQKAWLTAQVAASTARWKIASFHQPPMTSGFRAASTWMSWDELKLVDAIFCGHDHFYERLDYFGTPLFITGAGGQFLYTFRSPPDPRSLYRYNLNHSAMLITADATSLKCESRAFELPAGQETLVETYTLGNPAPIDNEDLYTFFAEEGEIIELLTTTPAPLSHPAIKLRLSLLSPGGPEVEPDLLSSPDGRNQLLTQTANATGRWSVKIGGTAGKGSYTLRLRLASPLPDYTAWSTSLPANQRGQNGDPDRDGLTNLIEYAFQTPARTGGLPADGAWQGLRIEANDGGESVTLTFDLPSPLPPGISYQLESSSLTAGPWQAIAWRTVGADWQADAGISVRTGAPLPGARRTAVTLSADALHSFFRIAVTRNG